MKFLTIGLAILALLICVLLIGDIIGYEQGYNKAFESAFPDGPRSAFQIHSRQTIYEEFSQAYILISSCLVIYILSKLLIDGKISIFVNGLPLLVTIYPFWNLIHDKNQFEFLGLDYSIWMNSTVYDWFIFGVICFLFLALIVEYLKLKNDAKD